MALKTLLFWILSAPMLKPFHTSLKTMSHCWWPATFTIVQSHQNKRKVSWIHHPSSTQTHVWPQFHLTVSPYVWIHMLGIIFFFFFFYNFWVTENVSMKKQSLKMNRRAFGCVGFCSIHNLKVISELLTFTVYNHHDADVFKWTFSNYFCALV